MRERDRAQTSGGVGMGSGMGSGMGGGMAGSDEKAIPSSKFLPYAMVSKSLYIAFLRLAFLFMSVCKLKSN